MGVKTNPTTWHVRCVSKPGAVGCCAGLLLSNSNASHAHEKNCFGRSSVRTCLKFALQLYSLTMGIAFDLGTEKDINNIVKASLNCLPRVNSWPGPRNRNKSAVCHRRTYGKLIFGGANSYLGPGVITGKSTSTHVCVLCTRSDSPREQESMLKGCSTFII